MIMAIFKAKLCLVLIPGILPSMVGPGLLRLSTKGTGYMSHPSQILDTATNWFDYCELFWGKCVRLCIRNN